MTLDKLKRCISIKDVLQCNSMHNIEQFWHFSEKCRVENFFPNRVVVENSGVNIEMSFADNTALSIVRGNNEIPLGWVSRSFGSKEPCTTLVANKQIKSSSTLNVDIFY